MLILLWMATLAGVVLLCLHFAGATTEARQQAQATAATRVEVGGPTPYIPPIPEPPPLAPVEPSIPITEPPPIAESTAPPAANSGDDLGLPIEGLRPAEVLDTFDQARGGGERKHEATDIMAPRGTPILAMTPGPVTKLFTSNAGGLTVYQFDMNARYCYYYAHLDRYADGLTEGMILQRGQTLGYAGSTGNANPEAPHLHLAIFLLGPEKKWYEGTPINPYPILLKLIERNTRR